MLEDLGNTALLIYTGFSPYCQPRIANNISFTIVFFSYITKSKQRLIFCLFFFSDKNQQLAEFLKLIRETPELNKIYEYIQKDSQTNSNSENVSMDQS